MITTELQQYIIKRQFIRNIELAAQTMEEIGKETAFTRTPEFKSSNNVTFEFNVMPLTETEVLKLKIPDAVIYPKLLREFKEHFRSNITTIAKYVMQDVSAGQIMKGSIPKFKDIKLSAEFLQWNFPAIQEIVAAYLNDTAIFWLEKSQFNVMLMFENKG